MTEPARSSGNAPPPEPRAELDRRYSDPAAEASDWAGTVDRLASAEVYWLTTVRPDHRPHVTPVLAVWLDGAPHFCTGAEERKNKNLQGNPEVVLTTGTNALHEGYDVVVEGTAVRLTDPPRLGPLARAYTGKYGEAWTWEVRDGGFVGQGGFALVYRVEPRTVFGFAKGIYGQTRFRFTES
ncbi:pyridoxamine 5'-phosphate oxidase family protein [Streptomyces sp. NPDC051018]|uniref:pyridoxamine 5'-phosphate oxidase family protein n=1 Tax=Streptomyces sp. NPDC051018 TaxID=3365639 RepID=UPI0037A04EC0